ncbi:MAG: sulfatase [Tannerella sp.]|jgi:arylsulfatase A-like enzyme|nr:sulfatase [Tannerella sp.]
MKKLNYIFYSTACSTACLGAVFSGCKKTTADVKHPNVLFICVDDFRPEAGCYEGKQYIKTPNLDRLAAAGVGFSEHYCCVPTSGASRYALLTGRYPQNRKAINNEACYNFISGKPQTPEPETFIHHLRRNGYYTVGVGKISHSADGYVYGYNEPRSDSLELPHSWDEMLFNADKWQTGWNAFFAYADGTNRQGRKNQVPPYECGDVDDNGYPDGLTAEIALRKLEQLSHQDKPFFLGVGFFKPHLPFNAPKKYWDMYDEASLPLTPTPDLPLNVNRESLHPSSEFGSYKAGDEDAGLDAPVSNEYARKLKHAYFACVSYTDAQIGKLLNKLDALGLTENTIVIVWGDHGWHLGDFRVWGKHTLFDWSLRSSLIISAPQHKGRGICNATVSTVDLYPTVLALCGVAAPASLTLDGSSLTPQLDSPATKTVKPAYGFFKQGITVRTDRYRLTKYFRNAQPVIELYDHETDPFETQNIAAAHLQTVTQLMPLLDKGDTGLYD